MSKVNRRFAGRVRFIAAENEIERLKTELAAERDKSAKLVEALIGLRAAHHSGDIEEWEAAVRAVAKSSEEKA